MRTPPAGVAPARTQIGPYHVVGWLGAGGMGHVYRGRDPRLERDVAIKLLKPETAGDLRRQRRLLAEGRAASALNHPNILTVYDADLDGDSYYLVTELIDGHPLRHELSRGSLSVRRMLDLATQVAEGLAAAHAAGIVHRDLKPENVMIGRDGRAKIVDFGLAIPSDEPMALVPGATTTTLSAENIRGTPAYMSPEQAGGKGTDYRSDQFAFGVLLYEMATGIPPFKRDTVVETLTAILNEEPAPIGRINPRVPALLRWIAERCLAKEPEERYAATEDLAREIRWLRDRLSELAGAPEEPTAAPSRLRRVALPIAILVAGVAAVAAVVARPPGSDLRSYTFTPIAAAAEYEGMPVWSPDGQTLAYVADVNGVLQIFTRRLNAALSNQVTFGQFDASEPFWAPGGQRIYFISQAGEDAALFSVGAAGGRPDLVVENVMHAAIDPSGTRLALLREEKSAIQVQRLWWASPDGTSLRRESRPPLNTPDGFGNAGVLRFRPDGSELLLWNFMSAREKAPERPSRFYLVPTDSGPPREVLASLSNLSNLTAFDWLPDNRHILISIPDARESRHLWIADTSSDSARPLTATHTNETFPAVSRDGTRVAYASEEVDFDLVLFAPDGSSHRRLLASARNEMDPVWAPAGDQLAFVTDRTGDIEIWLRSRDGQWERPLVTRRDFQSPTRTLGALAFSPDGRTLAYQRGALGQYRIWLSPVGGGPPVMLIDGDVFQGGAAWSPDGEWLAYASHTGGVFAVNKIRVGEKKPVVLHEDSFEFPQIVWSPDGQWIVSKGSDGLVRIPAAGGTSHPIAEGIFYAYTWGTDSRTMFALVDSETPGHFALAKIDLFTGEQTTVNPDVGAIPIANQPIRGLSLLKGTGFLSSFASARSDIWMLEGFAASRSWVSQWFSR